MSPQMLAPLLKVLGVDAKALEAQVRVIAGVAAGLEARIAALEQAAKLHTLQLELIVATLIPKPHHLPARPGIKPAQLDLIDYIDGQPHTETLHGTSPE